MAEESKDVTMKDAAESSSDTAPDKTVPRQGFAKLVHAKGAIVLTTKDKAVLGRKHKGDDIPNFYAIGTTKNISRTHAELFVQDEAWMITCVSKNGITLNGNTIHESNGPQQLRHKDQVQIGQGEFTFFFLYPKAVAHHHLGQIST